MNNDLTPLGQASPDSHSSYDTDVDELPALPGLAYALDRLREEQSADEAEEGGQ